MSAEEFGGLGFAPGVVRGVRSFDVDKFGRLTGIHYKQVWLPGENDAECRKNLITFNVSIAGYVRQMQNIQYAFAKTTQAIDDLKTEALVQPSPSPPKFPRRGEGKQSSIPAVSVKKMPPRPIGAPPSPDPEPVESWLTPAHEFGDCSCGFYGYFDGSDDYHDKARITAVVEGYGEVVIGTRGFRAMKARIVALRVKAGEDGITDHIARKVSNNYKDIPVFGSFESMVAEFPPDVSLEPSPETDPEFWTRK